METCARVVLILKGWVLPTATTLLHMYCVLGGVELACVQVLSYVQVLLLVPVVRRAGVL